MQSNLTQITSKLSALVKSGLIQCARNLFDELPYRDTVVWNAMLTGYSQLGYHKDAILLFSQMRLSDTRPDSYTFTSALSASAGLTDLQSGQMVHALAVVLGCTAFLPVNNSLIDMYGKCKSSYEARKVFEDMVLRNEVSWCSLLFAYVNAGHFDMANSVFSTMPKRVLVAWNTMISAHAKAGEVELCFELFRKMLEDVVRPDQCTLSALMNACAEGSDSSYGSMMHAFIYKSGWSSAVEVSNSIISAYTKFGNQNEILKILQCIGALNQVSWNAIIDAHMKTGNSQAAFQVFQQAPEKNVVSWTSIIAGFARNGNGEQAISFFVKMIRSGLEPDDFTFGAVLHACSSLATLAHGKMVHGCVIKSGFYCYSYIGNGLLNLYAKCGNIVDSCFVFSEILVRDLVSWNTMLIALGLYGLSSQAFLLFEKMLASGLKPDKVTFIGLLMTCSHSGLIKKGRAIFESMTAVHGISPDNDHVACMVDMLGRAGHLKEAREMAKKYSDDLGDRISSYEVLFAACSGQGNTEMGGELSEQLQILEPTNEMSYVLLSNMYCASGQWKEAEMLRREMANQEVKKLPGISWIELKNEMAYFFAGIQSNAEMREFSDVLSILESEMRHPISMPCLG
ncbi:OLC1v1020296C1 [Oldenlandia corymbosa var. corymbosa]|uniref:OLC1v1020296C1 n=1 Tax=Oldenlandia corymbosa var. corymbosa TaxID=529605 RepID=A0AAV1EGK7_OLDCO|nr:OLC1v1020296C1 [Oldenlandia corymbosa var. corymbosa]